jgi:hypothetical protein
MERHGDRLLRAPKLTADPPPGLPDWSASGKAVFEVEYRASSLNCTKSNGWNFSPF